MSLDQLSRVLKTSLAAQVVKIKLTKRQGACLTVEIAQVLFIECVAVYSGDVVVFQPTLTGASRTVTHEVPVSVVPERLWLDYQEPTMPDIDVRTHITHHQYHPSHTHSSLTHSYYAGEYTSASIEAAEEYNGPNESYEQLCREPVNTHAHTHT